MGSFSLSTFPVHIYFGFYLIGNGLDCYKTTSERNKEYILSLYHLDPQSEPITIEPFQPLPCTMPDPELSNELHVSATAELYQLDPSSTASGLSVACFKRISKLRRDWGIIAEIASNETEVYKCSEIENHLKLPLHKKFPISTYYSSMLPYQYLDLYLAPDDWSYPIFGTNNAYQLFLRLHKIPTTSDIRGFLTEPKPRIPCNHEEYCELDEFVRVYRGDFKRTGPCALIPLTATQGMILTSDFSENTPVKYMSSFSQVELNFPVFRNLQIACVMNDNPIFYSLEGALVQFQLRGKISELYLAYQKDDLTQYKKWLEPYKILQTKTDQRNHKKRGLTDHFDLVPMNSQASWIQGRMTTNEINALYLYSQQRNNSLVDFLTLRHLSCTNLYYIKMLAFYSFKTNPESWIRMEFPGKPFAIRSLNPVSVTFGTNLIIKYVSGEPLCIDIYYAIRTKGLVCAVTNITGMITHCTKNETSTSKCQCPFFVPTVSNGLLNICSGRPHIYQQPTSTNSKMILLTTNFSVYYDDSDIERKTLENSGLLNDFKYTDRDTNSLFSDTITESIQRIITDLNLKHWLITSLAILCLISISLSLIKTVIPTITARIF